MDAYAQDDTPPRRAPADDTYAYGCVCIEVSCIVLRSLWHSDSLLQVFTHEPPFPGVRDTVVQFKIIRGDSPSRPSTERCHGYAITDELWSLVARCLTRNPHRRPSMASILSEISQLRNGRYDYDVLSHVTPPINIPSPEEQLKGTIQAPAPQTERRPFLSHDQSLAPQGGNTESAIGEHVYSPATDIRSSPSSHNAGCEIQKSVSMARYLDCVPAAFGSHYGAPRQRSPVSQKIDASTPHPGAIVSRRDEITRAVISPERQRNKDQQMVHCLTEAYPHRERNPFHKLPRTKYRQMDATGLLSHLFNSNTMTMVQPTFSSKNDNDAMLNQDHRKQMLDAMNDRYLDRSRPSHSSRTRARLPTLLSSTRTPGSTSTAISPLVAHAVGVHPLLNFALEQVDSPISDFDSFTNEGGKSIDLRTSYTPSSSLSEAHKSLSRASLNSRQAYRTPITPSGSLPLLQPIQQDWRSSPLYDTKSISRMSAKRRAQSWPFNEFNYSSNTDSAYLESSRIRRRVLSSEFSKLRLDLVLDSHANKLATGRQDTYGSPRRRKDLILPRADN
jgi:hypothetical protein